MHKYQPRIHVIKKKDTMDACVDVERPCSERTTFSFPETVFTTVTAYQNQQVKKQRNGIPGIPGREGERGREGVCSEKKNNCKENNMTPNVR